MSTLTEGAYHRFAPTFAIPALARPMVRNTHHWLQLLRAHGMADADPASEATAQALLAELEIVKYPCGHYGPIRETRGQAALYCSPACQEDTAQEVIKRRLRERYRAMGKGNGWTAESLAKQRATRLTRYGSAMTGGRGKLGGKRKGVA